MAFLCRAARAVDEVDYAVDTPVCAPAPVLLTGHRLQEGHGPVLELVAVLLGQGAGAADVRGLADDLVVCAGVEVEGGPEPALHQGDGKVGDVDAHPAALQVLGGRHGGAAAAEWVEHHVALVGGRLYDALQEGLRLLGGET